MTFNSRKKAVVIYFLNMLVENLLFIIISGFPNCMNSYYNYDPYVTNNILEI